MSKLTPVHDYFMIEVRSAEDNPMNLVGVKGADEGVREGKVVDCGDGITFFGANTYMFDSSLLNQEVLRQLRDHYNTYVGKRVYWPERSETGAVIEHDGKTYAFVKWSSIMGVLKED